MWGHVSSVPNVAGSRLYNLQAPAGNGLSERHQCRLPPNDRRRLPISSRRLRLDGQLRVVAAIEPEASFV